MNPEFNTIQVNKPKRNFFDLSHERKFSFDMGQLVPIMCQEVLPGDTFNVVNQQLIRFAPMLAPIMHKVEVYTHYFFVPYRLVWDNWEEFITGNQGEAPSPVMPYVTLNTGTPFAPAKTIPTSSNADYLGLPVGDIDFTAHIQAFQIASLNLIWNEFYRDQNLQEELPFDLSDGDNTETFLPYYRSKPYRRAWEHDYFTSCLPWTQKGEEVFLTFDTEAIITPEFVDTDRTIVRDLSGNPINTDGHLGTYNTGELWHEDGSTTRTNVNIDVASNMEIDLSGSYLMSVNQLRQAMALQRWLELNARAGSRYIETILAHFGVRSDDARLQRPEYLGGGKSNVQFSEVLQMSQSDTTPQGTMAGHGINYGESHEFKSYFKEHGLIIGLMSVRPRTSYQQGIPKMFMKNDKFDYYWNLLAHLGEQPVYNYELYAKHSAPLDVFGYNPRYSEYKYINSSVHGDFTGNLNFWHLGRIFEDDPLLNSDFITCNATDRIFAVTDDEVNSVWCHLYQQVKATRPIPVFSTPLLNG